MTPANKVVLVKKLDTTLQANNTILSVEINIAELIVPMLEHHWWREDESKIDTNGDDVFLVLVFDKKDAKG